MPNENCEEVKEEKGACRSYDLSLHSNKNIKAQNPDSPTKNLQDWLRDKSKENINI